MKKILITGSSGFIGSFLVEKAIEKGYKVFAGIRKSSNLRYLQHPDITVVEFDLSNKTAIRNVLENQFTTHGRFDYIIHNAGCTQAKNESTYFTVNVDYTRNFIEAIIESGHLPDKFVYTSSLAAVGPGNPDNKIPITATQQPAPVTFYGKSKLKAEEYIQTLGQFPWVIVRPTVVYGPREENMFLQIKSIYNRIEAYIGSKNQLLSLVYVKDLVRIYFDILESDKVHNAYFGADGVEYTIKDFNAAVKQVANRRTFTVVFPMKPTRFFTGVLEKISVNSKKAPILNTDKLNELTAKNWLCDITPIKNDFNFSPQYTLVEALQETIDWYKEHKWL